MSIEEKKVIIRWLLDELYNKRNLTVIDELSTVNVVAHTPSADLEGREGWKKYASMFLTAFTDLHLTVEDLIAEGDKVMARWTATATHDGPLRGIAPTGKQVTLTGIAIYRFAGSKVVEGWALNDALGLMQQLGVIPPTE